MNFSYYGAFIWLPSLLVASGMSLTRSFGFTLVITLAQLPGYATSAVLVELPVVGGTAVFCAAATSTRKRPQTRIKSVFIFY